MKRVMLTVVMILCLGCLQTFTAMGETIENGGFESGKSGWSFNSGFFDITEDDALSGNKSMQLKYTYSYYPTYVTVTKEIAVEKNQEYVISYYYKQLSGGHIFSVYGTDMSNRITENFYTSLQEQWTKTNIRFNSGENEKIIIEVKDYSKSAPTVYFDEFEINSNQIKLYVSPDGNDKNDGDKFSPLKTLEGAKLKIRELRGNNLKIPAEVIFSQGEYIISEKVEFDEKDSGTEGAEVVYRAEEGAKVCFKGSMSLDVKKAEYVKDENIKSRMYPEVRDKILQFDLKEQGFPYTIKLMENIRYSYPLYGDGTNKEYVNLYLNGKEQMISQWPNGDDNYANWSEAVETGDVQGGTKGGTFRYEETNPENWTNIENMWIGGHPGNDFRYERNSIKEINAENKTITLDSPTEFGIKSTESKRWKAYNLLEEIDTPGEWYIDLDTMILYYYPPHDIENETLSISFLDEDMISISGAEFIVFSGLEFSQTRCGIFDMTDVSDITIEKCKFINTDGNAVVMKGTNLAITNNHWWQRQQLDAAYRCKITDNIFYNIGGSVIYLNGGNVDTLEKGENVFENNFVFRYGTKKRNSDALVIQGCGNVVKNNNISSGSFHAITYYGNDHTISNNEIYNVNKSTDDVGAIYVGRNYLHRGTEISYNYLHDLNPVKVLSRGFNLGIYFDDSACGQNVHHNIIVNSFIPIYTCGQSHNITDNIMVNSKTGMYITNNYENEERMNMYREQAATIADTELYYEKYENLEKGFTEEWGTKNAFNVIRGNLNVNAETVSIGSSAYNYGTVENNVKMNECSDFVDPEKQDYRIKSDSPTAINQPGLLNETFDIEKIGLTSDFAVNEETAGFNLIYPQNNEKLDDLQEIEFSWENAIGANRYRLLIAEDSKFEKIVYDEYVDYNIHTVSGLESNKYYWKVEAINISRELGNVWSSNDVFSFGIGDEFELVSVETEISDVIPTVKAEIINNVYKDGKNAKIIYAVYDKNDKLKKVITEDRNFRYKQSETFKQSVEISNGEKVSLMLWDENLIPLTEKIFSENSGNHIYNGGFSEKGNADRVADGWTSTSWWQWQWTENVGMNDTAGMHLIGTVKGWQTLTQDIAVKKNTEYTLSYYYKQTDPGHTFQINGVTLGNTIISEKWMGNVKSEWTKVEYTFNSGENDTIRIIFKEMCDIGGDENAVDVYVDSVGLYEMRRDWIKQ